MRPLPLKQGDVDRERKQFDAVWAKGLAANRQELNQRHGVSGPGQRNPAT